MLDPFLEVDARGVFIGHMVGGHCERKVSES